MGALGSPAVALVSFRMVFAVACTFVDVQARVACMRIEEGGIF